MGETVMALTILSEVFFNNGPIPSRYTCQGQDSSPPLSWSAPVKEAKSFALIVDDPDAPHGTFDHWIVWNLPANSQGLSEGAVVLHQGKNSYGIQQYRGPCPPPGKPHRYFFKLFALDAMLDLPEKSTKNQLEIAMKGHILAKTELVGIYGRR